MNLACKHALIERGVAHIILPDEVQELPATEQHIVGSPIGRRTATGISPDPDQLAAANTLLAQSDNPVIIVGHGARFAMAEITTLAERLNAPVLTTFKAKGLIADDHPLGCGVLGRSGTHHCQLFNE